MIFNTSAQLDYSVNGESSILASVKCLCSSSQRLISENFTTSRQVELEDLEVDSAVGRSTRIKVLESGPLTLNYQAQVETSYEVVEGASLAHPILSDLTGAILPFLYPSRYCQSDRLRHVATDIAETESSAFAKASSVVAWVYSHINYSIGISGPSDSAVDTLLNRQGVCRDFAHLAISLLRALSIPARYVTVYAHQLQPQDFHACLEAYIGGRWCFFDPTHLAPLNGVVKIARGRDAADVAVANLIGDIGNSSFQVSCDCADPSFQPLTQQSLHEKGQAIIFS
ncbi:MAG: transglutaminase-like domain-containing protein [Roseibacillus sp.]